MIEPRFLTLAEIFEIHADQIGRYGGSVGVRDAGMLESALAQPSAGFGQEYFHTDVFEMAAAYAYHLALNHPFVDGNKRAGLAAALIFLELNHVTIRDPKGKLHAAIIETAKGSMPKSVLAEVFRQLAK